MEETTLPFPQYAQPHSETCVRLRLITVLGNGGCVAFASFFGVPSALRDIFRAMGMFIDVRVFVGIAKWNVTITTYTCFKDIL
jgi:hypothetical protein